MQLFKGKLEFAFLPYCPQNCYHLIWDRILALLATDAILFRTCFLRLFGAELLFCFNYYANNYVIKFSALPHLSCKLCNVTWSLIKATQYPGRLGTNNGVQRCSLEVMPCSLAGVIACSRHTDQRWWGHVKEGKNSKGVGVGVGREGEGTLLSLSSPFFPSVLHFMPLSTT